MAEVKVYQAGDIEKALEDSWLKGFIAEHDKQKAVREQSMKEAGELAKGKELYVGKALKQDLVNDQIHKRVVKLSLPEVLLFSGQGRRATQREISEARR